MNRFFVEKIVLNDKTSNYLFYFVSILFYK